MMDNATAVHSIALTTCCSWLLKVHGMPILVTICIRPNIYVIIRIQPNSANHRLFGTALVKTMIGNKNYKSHPVYPEGCTTV